MPGHFLQNRGACWTERHADGFGHTAACGVQAEEVPPLTLATKDHTLFVWGNERAYDGVLGFTL